MPNAYTPLWFETFLGAYPTERTKRHLAFLKRQLPLPGHARILDVASGWGRIAGPLAWAGYQVVAVDRDRACVREGKERHPAVEFVELDQQRLPALARKFDGIVCLWQSFGWFDPATNLKVLGDMADLLAPGGRLILDLYHRDWVAAHQGLEGVSVAGTRVDTERVLEGRRLRVRVDYGAGKAEDFAWEVFTPREAVEAAARCGLGALLACADFEESTVPGPERQSFQLVLTPGRG